METYVRLKWVVWDRAAFSAEILQLFLVVLFHPLQMPDHVKLSTKALVVEVDAAFLDFPNLELLFAPATYLIDERGMGPHSRQLVDEPFDILRFKVLFHQVLEKKGVGDCLAEPENVNEPTLPFPFPPAVQVNQDLLSEFVFHSPEHCQFYNTPNGE
jgi:hypothetical protein